MEEVQEKNALETAEGSIVYDEIEEKNNKDGEEDEDEDLETDLTSQEGENFDADEEGEAEENEEIKVRKQRCSAKRKKFKSSCLSEHKECHYENVEGEEEDESENEEEEEKEKLSVSSIGSTIISAITFEWNGVNYEFEELCDLEGILLRSEGFPAEEDYEDSVKRYLQACKVLLVAPINKVIKELKTDKIDLSFRGIDSKNLKAMCSALEFNTNVQKLDLKYNTLSKADCFYLGRTLGMSETITHLDLTGCRIAPDGLKYLLEPLAYNDDLIEINLSKCNIQDEGAILLSGVLMKNTAIQVLNLSYNNLKEDAAVALAAALKNNSALTDLNLCYNSIFDPSALKQFFRGMLANQSVKHLNLAWNAINGVEAGNQIGFFLKKNGIIESLDLSDNRLEGLAVLKIKSGLSKSTSLKELKMGRNPIDPEDLEQLLAGAKSCPTLEILNLEDLWVNKSFNRMLNKQSDRNLKVIVGGTYSNYNIIPPDFDVILFRRARFEANKPKKKKLKKDFGHLMFSLGDEPLPEKEFMKKVKKFKAKVAKTLIAQIKDQFLNRKSKTVDVVAMRNKYLSVFPESTPPPPPKKKAKRKGKTSAKKRITYISTEGEFDENDEFYFGEFTDEDESEMNEESSFGESEGEPYSESEEAENRFEEGKNESEYSEGSDSSEDR